MRSSRWIQSAVWQLVFAFALAGSAWAMVTVVVEYRSAIETLTTPHSPSELTTAELNVAAWRHALRSIGAMALASFLLGAMSVYIVRRRLLAPIRQLSMMLAQEAATPDVLAHHGIQCDTDLAVLAEQIGLALSQTEQTESELGESRRSYEQLYQFVPAAIISIACNGRITGANRRAAELMGAHAERDLVGTALIDRVRDKDRGRFRQCIDRLDLERHCECSIEMNGRGGLRNMALSAYGLHDEHGTLNQVRIAMTDVTELRQLRRQVSDQQQLTDLIINHMSEAIMLVDRDGRIMAANPSLCSITNSSIETLIGQKFDCRTFWGSIDFADGPQSLQRLEDIAADLTEKCHEHFDARDHSYLFRIAPIHDETGTPVAQLWVVQDVTADMHNRRMVDQQSEQLQVMDQIGRQLHQVEGIDDLLLRSVRGLHEVMGVECVGLCLRLRDQHERNRQMINDGSKQMLLTPGADLADAVARDLMPQVLRRGKTVLWPDLSGTERWQGAMRHANIDTIAATVMTGRTGAEGILWIARRGGEVISPHQRFLLEAMAPILCSALENAQLRDLLRHLQLTDPATDLPNFHQFELMLNRIHLRTAPPWALLLIDVPLLHQAARDANAVALDVRARRAAQALRRACRTNDELARIDDSKFGLICPHCTREQAQGLMDRIQGTIAEASTDTPAKIPTIEPCAIGIASSPDDGDDADKLMQQAWHSLHHPDGPADPPAAPAADSVVARQLRSA